MPKLYGRIPQPRHRHIGFGESGLRAEDRLLETAFLPEPYGFVQTPGMDVAFLRDELDAQNVGAMRAHLIDQRFEQASPDALSLRSRMDCDRECSQNVGQTAQSVRRRVQLAKDRTRLYMLRNENDAAFRSARDDLVHVRFRDFIGVARDAAGSRGDGNVHRADLCGIVKRCGAYYNRTGQGRIDKGCARWSFAACKVTLSSTTNTAHSAS